MQLPVKFKNELEIRSSRSIKKEDRSQSSPLMKFTVAYRVSSEVTVNELELAW